MIDGFLVGCLSSLVVALIFTKRGKCFFIKCGRKVNEFLRKYWTDNAEFPGLSDEAQKKVKSHFLADHKSSECTKIDIIRIAFVRRANPEDYDLPSVDEFDKTQEIDNDEYQDE